MLDTAGNSNVSGHRLTQLLRELLRRPLTLAVAVLVFVSLIFLVVPSLDLAASQFFFEQSAGFAAGGSASIEGLRQAGRIVEWSLAIAVVLPLLLKILIPQSPLLLRPRASLFVLATLAIGPGLIVNGILKGYWGRARPRTILEFGGDATFSPVWWISDQCDRNCSFVSGEAASAFWLVTIAFLVPKTWRPAAAAIALAFAAAVSITRIATGAHFVSDVLLAWLITLCVAIFVHRLTLERMPPTFDRAVENAARRSGEALRRLVAGGRPPRQT
jgi:membrane-associated PAP2 superfamily phosphatase